MSLCFILPLISVSSSFSCSDVFLPPLHPWVFSRFAFVPLGLWRMRGIEENGSGMLSSLCFCHSLPSFYCFSTHHRPHLPTSATQPENCVRDGYKKMEWSQTLTHKVMCMSVSIRRMMLKETIGLSPCHPQANSHYAPWRRITYKWLRWWFFSLPP